ncbi:hypothetical protein M0R72_19755 [Candidatus Pacearchaeota archaeon]|jgi:hypothetical protein|nr:hypothetical protein [Candidatus Pacearchaeota archaeon]
MGADVGLYKFSYPELFAKLKGIGATDEAMLEKILLTFGFRFGDVYIILSDQHADDYNSYWSLGDALDNAFGIDDSFELIVNMSDLLDAHKSANDLD